MRWELRWHVNSQHKVCGDARCGQCTRSNGGLVHRAHIVVRVCCRVAIIRNTLTLHNWGKQYWWQRLQKWEGESQSSRTGVLFIEPTSCNFIPCTQRLGVILANSRHLHPSLRPPSTDPLQSRHRRCSVMGRVSRDCCQLIELQGRTPPSRHSSNA